MHIPCKIGRIFSMRLLKKPQDNWQKCKQTNTPPLWGKQQIYTIYKILIFSSGISVLKSGLKSTTVQWRSLPPTSQPFLQRKWRFTVPLIHIWYLSDIMVFYSISRPSFLVGKVPNIGNSYNLVYIHGKYMYKITMLGQHWKCVGLRNFLVSSTGKS